MKRMTIFQQLIAAALLTAIGWLAYANTFQAEFHFDDYTYIVDRQAIRDITDYRAVYRALGHPSRFIAFYSFALNYHFHQDAVFGFHLVNWIIHIMNGVLLCGFVWLLFQTPRWQGVFSPNRAYWCALIASLLFVVHPLQTEAVTYVVQRFTSLATLFYLAAIVSFVRGRLRTGPSAAVSIGIFVMATILGMFTKQICFTIPFVVILIELCCFREHWEEMLTRRWKLLLVLALLLLIIPSFFGFNAAHILGREFPSRSHTGDTLNSWTYALTQTRVVPTYLRLWIWPVGQTLDYDFQISSSFRETKVFAGLALLLALLGIGILAQRRRPLIALALGWFFITIAVTSSLIPIPHVIFEHRAYLPSVGLCLLMAYGLCHFLSSRRRLLAASGIIILTLTAVTYQRNAVWQSDISLWQDIIAKAPNKLRAYNNLGMALLEEGKARQSLEYFDEAIARNPDAGRVYNNRGMAYLALGEEDKALADFNQAVDRFYASDVYHSGKIKSIWSQVFLNRAKLRLKHKDVSGARQDLLEAVKISPADDEALYQLGYVHELAQDFEAARNYYGQAMRANPQAVRPLIGMGYVYQYQGDDRRSVVYFDTVLERNPGNAEALFFRSISRFNLKDHKRARQDMQQAVRNGFKARTPELNAAREKILALE